MDKSPKWVKAMPIDGRGTIGVCIVYTDGSYHVSKAWSPTEKMNDLQAYAKQIAAELDIPVK